MISLAFFIPIFPSESLSIFFSQKRINKDILSRSCAISMVLNLQNTFFGGVYHTIAISLSIGWRGGISAPKVVQYTFQYKSIELALPTSSGYTQCKCTPQSLNSYELQHQTLGCTLQWHHVPYHFFKTPPIILNLN